MDIETRWLSYNELGIALGIAPTSAKRLALRNKWAKKPGNDGKARVAVPAERLSEKAPSPPVTDDIAGDVASDVTDDIAGDENKGTLTIISAFNRHIERLERDLEAVKALLDIAECERTDLTIQVNAIEPLRATNSALKSALEAEKARASELRRDRDEKRDQAEKAQADLAEFKSRPWWRRAFG